MLLRFRKYTLYFVGEIALHNQPFRFDNFSQSIDIGLAPFQTQVLIIGPLYGSFVQRNKRRESIRSPSVNIAAEELAASGRCASLPMQQDTGNRKVRSQPRRRRKSDFSLAGLV